MRRAFYLLFAVVTMAYFTACSGNSQKKSKSTVKIEKEEVQKEIKNVVYPLPTSFEVTEMLNRIEASYILTLSNPPGNVDNYITEKEKALALGVYGADLSYASTYHQKQRTIDYMRVSKKLLEELDISAAVDPDIIEQIESVENDKEKLVEIISNSFYSTYEYLNNNDRGAISLLVLSGSWIEALYIATHISDETFDNKEMVTIIMNQKKNLIKLMALLKKYQGDEAVAEAINVLNPLYEIYDTIDEGSITKKQMKEIAAAVEVARKQII